MKEHDCLGTDYTREGKGREERREREKREREGKGWKERGLSTEPWKTSIFTRYIKVTEMEQL